MPAQPSAISAFDDWMFDAEIALEAERIELSTQMDTLADSLSNLRETLALIHGEVPYPVEATTQMPCAIVHHDDALFEGEMPAPLISAQEDIVGGEGVFLFDDAPDFEDELATEHAAQQAA